jgi:16S rRNA (adenine1518-N6/adenine1519-N6)-dimethyltransferase
MRAKRSLGQNFLKNIGIARKMAALAGVGPGDTVVEVGPGKGMLTRVLLDQASRVIAVERDDSVRGPLPQHRPQ